MKKLKYKNIPLLKPNKLLSKKLTTNIFVLVIHSLS